jgi:hypothetical protein
MLFGVDLRRVDSMVENYGLVICKSASQSLQTRKVLFGAREVRQAIVFFRITQITIALIVCAQHHF